ncbi:MAG: fumarylacetoacetate hydrolase family protein [Halioglobus sp.]
MGTSVVRYHMGADCTPSWGVLRAGAIFPLVGNFQSHQELMRVYFEDRGDFEARVGAGAVQCPDVRFLSPVTDQIQLFCQGLNYADHRIEGGLDKGSEHGENLFFTKAPSSICGPNDDIVRPAGCELLDYEIELGVVLKVNIGGATNIPEQGLGEVIGALVLANDVSARDFMFGAPAMQWFRGKSQRTFCPMGPVLYLLDDGDLRSLYSLDLVLKLNGKVKQAATTDRLIHKPATSLSEWSTFTNLRAGDCLLTGTARRQCWSE